MPKVRIHMHRSLPEGEKIIQTVQVVKEKQQWFVVITVKQSHQPPALVDDGNGLGIDVGLQYIIAESGAEPPVEHPKWLKNSMLRYRDLSQAYERKRRKNNPQNYDAKGRIKRGVALEWVESNNEHRNKVDMRNLHRKISNQRRAFWDVYVDKITKQYTLIAIEDMNATWMRGKPELRRLSADAGLGMFRLKLEHKCRERGVLLIRVNPMYTSQTCFECGHQQPENRVTRDCFRCMVCGYTEHADTHAAKNILKRAYEDVDTARTYLVRHGDILRKIAEARPQTRISLCRSTAKDAKVRHWTTISQVADLLTRTILL